MPSLDIVIVNWNAGSLLRQCLESVFTSDLGNVELQRMVVVDNASTDGSMDDLPFASPPFIPIRLPENLGFGSACNIGAAESTADYILFLNPDTVLGRDSLRGALMFMEAADNRKIAASSIRLNDTAGVTQRCCARFPTVGRMLAQSVGLDRLVPRLFPPHFMTEWDHQDTRPVPQIMGAFLLIRRSIFTRLGGFDEQFFVYYEDVDLCRRIALDGGICVHNAAVSATHVGCGSTDRIKARRQFYNARGRIQYAWKYFGWPGSLALALDGLLIAPLARSLKGVLNASLTAITDAVQGSLMLWADLPNILSRGNRPISSLEARSGSEARPISILALTRYPRQGASSRTRFLNYLPALKAEGIDVTVSPFFDETYLPALYGDRKVDSGAILKCYRRRLKVLHDAQNFDLIWVEKEILPWIPSIVEQFAMRGMPFILDFDDAWFLRYATHPSPLVRALLGKKFEHLIQQARGVIVGNSVLTDWARKAHAREIVQLPTPVDLDRDHPDRSAEHGGPIRIGWIGTPSTAEQYLRPLLPTLEELISEGIASFTVIGASHADFTRIGATTLPWREADEVEQLYNFDVGIMPLTDDPWTRGKCAFKLIQYMAVGLPVVASPVGMNNTVVQHGINGFLANSREEWREAILTLARTPALRSRMGSEGRNLVAREYCVSAVYPRLSAALRKAAGAPPLAAPSSQNKA
ncbi:glycosyltransferase [Telmatospirillum siberiense]|uniref:Glycosyltransferase 2-like domain-containing protein n=1 Tax=Telmatospirillum siberiense TaxID=382514 RepID=A0A2N3PYE7_9PROT|nr:glycosyltransferase [Telmatospirillum siberiense]PKU25395.1 hypothetical protein CWS72_07345 [Telmatospirillum siberiense]